MIEKNTVILNQLAKGRSDLVGFSRFLNNEKITTDKLIGSAVHRCGQLVEDRHVLIVNDTTDFNFRDHYNYLDEADEHLGPMSNEGDMGFYLHPGLVVDAQDGMSLGFSYVKIWNRTPGNIRGRGNKQYVRLPLQEKESYRWIECGMESKKNLQKANHLTIIADRESDIYEEFAWLADDKTDLIIRSCQNRTLQDSSTKLYETISEVACCGEYHLNVRGKSKGKRKRKGRDTVMEVRYKKVRIRKPSTVRDPSVPAYLDLYAVEAKEKAMHLPVGEKPICWRLLTTYTVEQFADALHIIQWYTKRWQIELLFGTLKSKGLNFGESEVESGSGLKNLCILALQVALKINQLSQGRENENEQSVKISFTDEQTLILKALKSSYEGKTEKQKNPYREFTLAWAAWIIARMGGWKGYSSESKPGNKTMRIGLMQLENIAIGWALAKKMCA
jgi:hypothetical protein